MKAAIPPLLVTVTEGNDRHLKPEAGAVVVWALPFDDPNDSPRRRRFLHRARPVKCFVLVADYTPETLGIQLPGNPPPADAGANARPLPVDPAIPGFRIVPELHPWGMEVCRYPEDPPDLFELEALDPKTDHVERVTFPRREFAYLDVPRYPWVALVFEMRELARSARLGERGLPDRFKTRHPAESVPVRHEHARDRIFPGDRRQVRALGAWDPVARILYTKHAAGVPWLAALMVQECERLRHEAAGVDPVDATG